MSHRHPNEEVHGLEGPDYVTLVIEWDSLADNLERGTAAASSATMPNQDQDWLIDEASKESFPASDPPAWGSSRAAPSESTATEGLEDIGVKSKKHSRGMPILLGVLGLFALTGILAGVRFVRNR